ncbi:S41 family peptidase [Bacteroides sp.]|uniref:S41 family peptidase n=1 Tax=Bacteroides sp. TaxID=29523 RepID=UPI00261004EC|nr:S41 family peptidase [Bacteroides sp.]
MKARNILLSILGTLIVPIYLTSCGEDRWPAYAAETATDRWIDDSMRVWYYWNEEMPPSKEVNYFLEPFKFFSSILSKKDGKNSVPYSTIDSLVNVTRSIPYTDKSYGFQFTIDRVEDNDTAYYAHILYVAQNSPASAINMERGDWIMDMNGEPITKKNFAALYGSGAMKLTVGYYDVPGDTIIAYKVPREIAAARAVNDNPVFYKNVYERAGKRIGYLVYNHFSAGITDNSNEYNNDLRSASQYFASNQINDFVLDLRYNNGGLLSCAELMCALLAPADKLGQELGFLEFNTRFNPRQVPFNLDANLIQNGANLNLNTLYVITSDQTASASEMVINCLKPFMQKVVLIGSTTEGKNVGSRAFSSPELMITMSPIICMIYNSKSESDYDKGFKPDYAINENSNLAQFLPFGDPNELLLSTALGIIDGSIELDKKETRSLKVTTIANSIEKRASHAVRIK